MDVVTLGQGLIFGLASSTVDLTANLLSPPNGAALGAYLKSEAWSVQLNAPGANGPSWDFHKFLLPLRANLPGAYGPSQTPPYPNFHPNRLQFGFAGDTGAGLFWVSRNGVWMTSGNDWNETKYAVGNTGPMGDPAAGTGGFALNLDAWYFFAACQGSSDIKVNCGQDPFNFAPPAGFTAAG